MMERLRNRLNINLVGYVPVITLVALLAAAAFYFMGFAQAAVAHDVFHDLRHAVGLPCH